MSIQLREGQYFGHTIKKKETGFAKFNITKYDTGAFIDKHYHENNYLSILIQGKYTENNQKANDLIRPGAIIFRPLSYDHINHFGDAGGTCFNIEFKKDWQHKIDFNFSLPKEFCVYKTGSFPALYQLLSSFVNNNESEHLQEELLFNWLFEINQQVPVKSTLPWVEKVKNILKNELATPHTIHSLSERVFVHPVYLAGGFKKKTGFTVGEYQMKTRLKHAISLLFNSCLSINEIALHSGFYDSAHFINSFKIVYHISPHQFRLSLKS